MALKIARLAAVLGGLLLIVIGLRFMLVPDDAARSFGLGRELSGTELHSIIGLRDVWLGALAAAFAWLKQWRALALWFGLGAVVCFADASIAFDSSGRTGPIAFHAISGALCLLLAAVFWRRGVMASS
jgi:hypothetical protein